jgi:dihydrofolate reductase
MRKLAVSQFMTLDGVIQDPHHWSFPYWTDEIGDFKLAELIGSDALLLGRVTYEGFAEAWPSRTDEAGFADRINGMPKYVVSSTLKEAAWNNSSIISENVVAELTRLKEQPGQEIMVNGSATLIETLIEAGLVDEYRLLVYPLVLGEGLRLFPPERETKLKLAETRSYNSGVVLLRYQTDKSEL